jgi:hypothetical protein
MYLPLFGRAVSVLDREVASPLLPLSIAPDARQCAHVHHPPDDFLAYLVLVACSLPADTHDLIHSPRRLLLLAPRPPLLTLL